MSEQAISATIDDTHEASVLSCDGQVLCAICSVAFPPGRPLELELRLPEQEVTLVGRCIGTKKRTDGAFDLRMRLTNLRRETRETLQRAFTR